MAILLATHSISSSYGSRTLFEEVSVSVAEGDRVGMIGPNGAGKSTFMRIAAGLEEPDRGSCSTRGQTVVAHAPQVPRFAPGATVKSVVNDALMGAVSDEVDATTRVASTLSRAGFPDNDASVESLSGGWRKRLAIAAALVRNPDVLLLDEPTNHLDLEGVLWLEKLLVTARFAVLVVSHDRRFLENTVNRMVELNKLYPGGCFTVQGNYSEFLLRRDEFLAAQERRGEALANRVRREVEWLRRGPRARAGKSRSRINEAGRLIGELADLQGRQTKSAAAIDFEGSGRRSRQLLIARGVGHSMGGRPLFKDVDLVLSPGSCLGLLGQNGSGKTTLLRLLAGELEPDLGTIEHADALQIVTFDQNREQLDLRQTLRHALAPSGGDSVVFQGNTLHVAAWAKRFLFSPEQLDVALGSLSGGEQARVFLARLMLRPADLLLLDEPTNDLDIETLEILEETLSEFAGALVLVTHDRFLLDRISTGLLALNGEGKTAMFADYSQWENAQRSGRSRAVQSTARPIPSNRRTSSGLTSRERNELRGIEERIVAAETEVMETQRQMELPEVATDATRLGDCWTSLEAARQEVDRLYTRWQELEDKLNAKRSRQ